MSDLTENDKGLVADDRDGRKTVRVDVVFDPICPWCLIGWERFKKARALVAADLAPDIHWLPFELNPDMPETGMDRRRYYETKFGPGGFERVNERVSAAAAGDGTVMHLAAIPKTPSTLGAHRLVQWAEAEEGGATPLVEALFEAFFVRMLDIGDQAVLADLAGEAGLVRDKAVRVLASLDFLDEVRALERRNHEMGIAGVPFYIVDRRLGLSGAQPPDLLAQALRKAMTNV